ncbi:MAG: glycosyltransferase family 2 protein [Pseudomonadota bacterium]
MTDAAASNDATPAVPKWSVVIPAYNEESFLGATVDTIKEQTRGEVTIILVDNNSTDRTRAIMDEIAETSPERKVTVLADPRPGKINALETGIRAVDTEFIALCDADTLYPKTYLERAETMMNEGDGRFVAAFAFGVYGDDSPFRRRFRRCKGALMARIAPGQGHTGGYGQSFRTEALRDAGGYSASLWPYMVADHEIVNRILKVGAIAYHYDHYCETSPRRGARGNVDWRLHERLLYNFLPHSRQDWFFYEYLKPRFEARKMFNANLRDRDWDAT